jgi:hypothetical protein
MRIALLALAAALTTTGCAPIQGDFTQSIASTVEEQLNLAGFHLLAADTPQRIDSVHGLPALAFSRVVRNGREYFVYADPVSCLCLYVGTPANYQRFLQLSAEAEMNGQETVAQDIELQADVWDPEWGTVDDPMDPVIDPDL